MEFGSVRNAGLQLLTINCGILILMHPPQSGSGLTSVYVRVSIRQLYRTVRISTTSPTVFKVMI